MIENPRYAGVVQPLPRRKRLIDSKEDFLKPLQMHHLQIKVGYFRVVLRLCLWLVVTSRFLFSVAWDYLKGRRGEVHTAIRLRQAFEFLGGTFVKIGQQLSLRIDVLPYAYCEELSKMLDRMPSFSHEYALERVGAVCGKEVQSIFSAFDPKPIGSASIACVFQATLTTGELVAVKVRRPDVARKFAADLQAIDWLCLFLEAFSLLRPGFTKNLRDSLKSTFLEELDFTKETRYQELFRRSAKRSKLKIVSAPKVYFEYCSDDVIVMEFVQGISLTEIIAGIERKDEGVLSVMREQNIKPKKVARRLLWVNHAAMISELFFHSDPNPGNIIVLPNSKLVFIDFGSCGTFSHSQKRALKEINYYQHQGDAEGMAKASIAMMGPLPPIDVDAFAHELEALYRTSVFAMRSKKSAWWERTTASQWFAFLKASMKFKVPLPDNILHMVRATLLYDTVSSRLYNKTIFYDEFRRYEKYAGEVARKRLKKEALRTITKGPDPSVYLRIMQLIDTSTRAFFRIQRFLDMPTLNFASILSKGAYVFMQSIRVAVFSSAVLGVGVAIHCMVNRITSPWKIVQSVPDVAKEGWFLIFLGITLVVNVRFIAFRISDKGGTK